MFTLGKPYKPNYSSNFPAKLIDTPLDWDDLILNKSTSEEVVMINTWIENKTEIESNHILKKKINAGYKCLFYGPPGTGKTLTASLVGKKNKKDVYRIDLSQVVSKYIGETEKNLANIFDIAENKNWILFFDEAESLFSKRTAVSDSKDKHANQQTAYLLQRVENYKGLIILATNLKPNIDLAFSRRIQSIINFPIPSILEREKLWITALNNISDLPLSFIKEISKSYSISGGVIKNVIQYAWLISKRKKCAINEKQIILGIRRELNKDGKSFDN
jgi:SpoVK/Ycf46/Vps4 family AAA+-type ATPase